MRIGVLASGTGTLFEAILAAAPEDQQGFITRLQTDGTLPYDNVADLLSDALAGQGDRQRWILEHWPHIVEYAELRAVTDTPGPDMDATLVSCPMLCTAPTP